MKIIITLGHNASAVGLTNKGKLIAGYKEERLSGKKVDSKFPRNAISKLLQVADNEEFERENTLYVSHCFDDFNFDENKTAKEKHWDYNYIRNLKELYGFKIVKLNEEFTHHDAHTYAANSFYKQHGEERQIKKSNWL
jgi:predicted NodU family carbamoyl transferase